jgi:hypothetical protein
MNGKFAVSLPVHSGVMPTTDGLTPSQARPWTGERGYWVLIGAAIGWGIVILLLAVTYPAVSVDTGRAGVQPMRSLVAADGDGVLWVAAIPLLIAMIVGCLHRARPDARWALTAEWILSGALLLASLAGFVTIIIGIYVLPAAALLVIATGQAGSRRTGASRVHGKHPLDDANSRHPPAK